MGKVKELSMLVDEIKSCVETLIGISDELTKMFSSATEEKKLTLEEVRSVLAEKSRLGFTDDVKAIIEKHGADKLSDIDPSKYESVLKEVEVLGNA